MHFLQVGRAVTNVKKLDETKKYEFQKSNLTKLKFTNVSIKDRFVVDGVFVLKTILRL